MIVNGKPTTASVALDIFLSIKPCYDSFAKLKNRLTIHSRDSRQTVQGKMLLLAMIASAEQMFYHEPCKRKRNYEISLRDVRLLILDALWEMVGLSLLPKLEIPPTAPDTSKNDRPLRKMGIERPERCTCCELR